MTQRHLDLKNELYERVTQKGTIPDVEAHLRATIAKLKKTVANKNEELERLRASVAALVRVVNQLTLENPQLRDCLAGMDPQRHLAPAAADVSRRAASFVLVTHRRWPV